MNDERPDETSPLLPGEFVQWRNILWHEVADVEMRSRIAVLFDQHWANELKAMPYYSDRMFLRMWGHYNDPRKPNA